MIKMTNEQAAAILDNIDIEHWFQEEVEALDMAVDALMKQDECTVKVSEKTGHALCGCGGSVHTYKGECGYGVGCDNCDLMTCGEISYVDAASTWDRARGLVDPASNPASKTQ